METQTQEKNQFESFLENFNKACEKAERKKSEITLLPVSKGQGVTKIKSFLALGNFPQELAENYVDELTAKARELPHVKWHFQGSVQSRKIDEILKSAAVIQSISRIKELEFVFKGQNAVSFYLQVNISSEGQKRGASQDEIKKILEYVNEKKLEAHFLGFMGVASEVSDSVSETTIRKQFASLREFKEKISPQAKLSMGMSSDYHLAILEGSDLIRVGSSIFGARPRD